MGTNVFQRISRRIDRSPHFAKALARRFTSTSSDLCIFKPDGIGDLILASGAIKLALKESHAQSATLLVSHQSADAARFFFPGTNVIQMPMLGNSLLRLAAFLANGGGAISRANAEAVLCLRHQRTLAEEVLLSKLGGKVSIGLQNLPHFFQRIPIRSHCHRFTRTAAYPVDRLPGICRELEANRTVAELFLGRYVDIDEVLPRLASRPERPGILVSPFGGRAKDDMRDLPMALLRPVLSELHQKYGGPLILTSAPRATHRLADVARELEGSGLETQIARTATFAEFFQLVAESWAVFTTDTATAHLATAMDKPTIVILGGADYGFFGPWERSPKQRWISNHMECFGCNWACKYEEPRCITEVSARSIVAAFSEVVSR